MSLVLITELAILPSRAAQDDLYAMNAPTHIKMSFWDTLRIHGLRRRMVYIWKMCTFKRIGRLYSHAMSLGLFFLAGAVLCTVLSIATFVGTREDFPVKVTVLVFFGSFILPLLSMIWILKGE